MLKKFSKHAIAIFVLALALRFYGIDHGFPFIFHIDEPALIRSAVGIRFNPNPHHFDWPHLHFYLNFLLFGVLYVVRGVFQVLGLRELIEGFAPILWRDPLVFYLLARIFDAILGSLTVLVLYQSGKKLFSERVGLLAAAALAVFPYHVWSSHFALIDVPMVFWSAICFYFSVLIYKEGKLKWYLLAGIFAGLSASTKYNGGYSVFFIFLAHVLYLRRENLVKKLGEVKKLGLAALASIIAFFAGTPYAIIDHKTFLIKDTALGAFWQFTNVGRVNDLNEFMGQLTRILTVRFDSDFGYSLLFIFEIYVIYFLLSKKTREKTLIFLPGILYFLYITTFERTRIHYYMLTFPFVCLMVAQFLDVLLEKAKNKFVFVAILLITFLPPLYVSTRNDLLISRPDNRKLASDWLDSNVTEEQTVLHYGGDIESIMVDRDFKVKRFSNLASLSKYPQANFLVIAANEPLEKIKSFDEAKDQLTLLQEYSDDNRTGPDVYIFSLNSNSVK